MRFEVNVRYITAMTIALCGAFASSAQTQVPQTPLAKAFADLRSSDPAVVKQGNDELREAVSPDFKNIQQESGTICSGISDPDNFIRSQASALYATIAQVLPEDVSMIRACIPGLIRASSDDNPLTSRNSLSSLALLPEGPPPGAHSTFEKHLTASDDGAAQMSAVGLLRENQGDAARNAGNITQVVDALQEAPDTRHRSALLTAIIQSKVKSDVLSQAAARMLGDSDKDVRTAAITALTRSAPDPARAVPSLQTIVDSPSSSLQEKRYAQAEINKVHPN